MLLHLPTAFRTVTATCAWAWQSYQSSTRKQKLGYVLAAPFCIAATVTMLAVVVMVPYVVATVIWHILKVTPPSLSLTFFAVVSISLSAKLGFHLIESGTKGY